MKRVDLSEVREVIADRKRRSLSGSRDVCGPGWHRRLAEQDEDRKTTELLQLMLYELEMVRSGPKSVCTDPDKMHGAADEFPGSDYP